jgi:hypothetical protein
VDNSRRHGLDRSDDKTSLTGVLAGAGYRRSPETPGLLRLSPLDIAWK